MFRLFSDRFYVMNRFFTIIVSVVLFVAFTSFFLFQTGVTIKADMPDVIEAGTEITVNVTINKGKLRDFAHFKQTLPDGFTARAVNSANADFRFEDQTVRLTWWLTLPEDNEITFSYNIIADERLTGKIDLNGTFTYVENNERKSVDLQPQLLAIQPSPNVNPAMQIDILDYARLANIEAVASKGGIVRQQPVWMDGEKVFLVTLLVIKEANQKYTKIEETIPAGYTAANVDSKNGIFTYKDQVAKFIWMDLPPEPYFTVTYKLIPEEGTPQGPASLHLAGAYSYMLNDRTFTSGIPERKESLAGLNKDQVHTLLREVNTQAAEQPVLIASSTKPAESTTPSTAPPTTTPTTPTKIPSTSSASSVKPITITNTTGDLLTPESGIYYRVQIAAGHKPVNTQRYFRKYRLEYSVMKEIHDGWLKYSIGSFPEYKDARDYRVHLSNTTTINDAFIAAYNNGNRITVQEALMAVYQTEWRTKWYK